MKKRGIIVLLIIGFSLLIFYGIFQISKMSFPKTSQRTPEEKAFSPLENLPENYTVEEAINDGCVVISNGKRDENLDKLKEFKDCVEQKIPVQVRIVEFTVEGDMLIKELELSKEGIIIFKQDSTRDRFSSKEDQKITETTYSAEEYHVIEEEYNKRKNVYLEKRNQDFSSRIWITSYPISFTYQSGFTLIYQRRKDAGIEKIIEKGENSPFDVYTFGGDVYVNFEEEKISLKEAVEQKKVKIEDILHNAILDAEEEKVIMQEARDGGARKYTYPLVTPEPYAMIKCYTLDGKRELYFGMPQMYFNGETVEIRYY